MEEVSESRDAQICRFCHQFLQVEQHLDYPSQRLLREYDVQEELHRKLFDPSGPIYLPPRRYQLKTLKELVARIESSIDDWEQHGISEALMSSLSSLLASPLPSELAAAQQKCYVTYHLSTLRELVPASPASITLLESRALISAFGTTGLRTWEAALHLGQYLCAHPEIIRGRRVLELGAGTGYLSVLAAKYLGAAQTIASDGSDDVINNLPESFFLNGLQDSTSIRPMDLKWGHALLGTEEKAWNGGNTVDVVVGADITYDSSVIPALVGTLEELSLLFPRVNIIIAATERNRVTFEAFQGVCRKVGFAIEQVNFPVPRRSEQMGPFYSDLSPIHICILHPTRPVPGR